MFRVCGVQAMFVSAKANISTSFSFITSIVLLYSSQLFCLNAPLIFMKYILIIPFSFSFIRSSPQEMFPVLFLVFSLGWSVVRVLV